MDELNVCVLEEGTEIGTGKAQMLAQLLVRFYYSAPAEVREEIDRQAGERKEHPHDK